MKKQLFQSLALCGIFLSLVSVAHAANELFLSNDTAESEATYVIQFESGVNGNIDKSFDRTKGRVSI